MSLFTNPKIVIVLLLLVGLIAYVVGTNNQSLLAGFNLKQTTVATSKDTNQQPQGSMTNPSANIEKNNPAPPKSVENTNYSQPGYSTENTSDKVSINGTFTIPVTNKIFYNFSFPKQGGELSGSTTGACSGTITGSINKPDQNS